MLRNVRWWPTTSSRATNCVARKGFVGAQGPRLAARADPARSACALLQVAARARLWKAVEIDRANDVALHRSVHFL